MKKIVAAAIVAIACMGPTLPDRANSKAKDFVANIQPKPFAQSERTITPVAGKLYASTGYRLAVDTIMTKGKIDTVWSDSLKEIPIEPASDSTAIQWYSATQYYVINKLNRAMVYRGTFSAADPVLARQFVAKYIKRGGKLIPSNAVYNRAAGTYQVTLLKGDTLDPGYASASGLVGLVFNGTRPASYDTVGRIHLYCLNSDTGAGGVVADSSGSAVALSGAFINGAFDSAGARFGNGCMVLPDDNGDNALMVYDSTSLDGATSWTFSCWAYFRDTTNQQVLFDNRQTSSTYLLAQYATKKLRMDVRDGGAGAFTFTANNTWRPWKQWVHLAYRKTAYGATDTLSIFANGVKILGVTTANKFNSVANLGTMYFGGYSGGNVNFAGRMDNISMYSAAKSAITIATEAIAGREMWRGPDTTTTGLLTVDTAGLNAQADSIWFAVGDTSTWRKFPVDADNAYDVAQYLTNNATNTVYVRASNDVAPGGVTAYSVVVAIATDQAKGTYKQRPYKANSYSPYKQPAFKQGDAF